MNDKTKKPQWVRFFPSDFLAGCTLMTGKHRAIYAYLLILQADQGAITMSIKDLAMHLEANETDVSNVLDIKFDFNVDINGWVNPRMAEESARSGRIYNNKIEGAAKARAKKSPPQTPPKEKQEEENRTDSDIKLDINPDTNVEIKKPRKSKAKAGSQAEVEDFARSIGLPETDGSAFFQAREGNGWLNKGQPIKDWKATMRSWKIQGYHPSQKNGINGKPKTSSAEANGY